MGFVQRWRRSRSGRCRDCGEPLTPVALPRCAGHHEGVGVSLLDVPVLACSDPTHPRRWADAEFGAALTEAIFGSADVPVARLHASGRSSCFRCGEPVDAAKAHHGRVTGALSLAGLVPFRVEIEAPAAACTGCGELQALSSREHEFALCEALRLGLEQERVEP